MASAFADTQTKGLEWKRQYAQRKVIKIYNNKNKTLQIQRERTKYNASMKKEHDAIKKGTHRTEELLGKI